MIEERGSGEREREREHFSPLHAQDWRGREENSEKQFSRVRESEEAQEEKISPSPVCACKRGAKERCVRGSG